MKHVIPILLLPIAACSVAMPPGSDAAVAANVPLVGAAAEITAPGVEGDVATAELQLSVRRVGRRDWNDQGEDFRDCLQQQGFVGASVCPCFFISEFAENARLSSSDYRDAGCLDSNPVAPPRPPAAAPPQAAAPRTPLAERVAAAEGNPGRPYRDAGGRIHSGFGDLADGGDWDRLEANLALAREDAAAVFGDAFAALDEPRRDALTELAFVLGRTSLIRFTGLRAAVQSGDWLAAGAEVVDSAWAKQDGPRATRIARVLRGG